ncbi:MAG TPA: aspartate kinase [Firmicutes bacterium]|nr:aspartate kinase [Bacillota bacterium]
MRIIVQKFGGTSVSTPSLRKQAAERILEAKRQGYSPVVVVSAMGRAGDPYATDTLIQLLKTVDNEPDPRDQDLLLSCGEIISSVLVSGLLKSMGHPAVALTGAQAGIITDDRFGDTRIIEVKPDLILQNLRDGKIVVVAGFQGVTQNGEVTTLGRGGSDTTAAALGAALNAEVVEIYTDVDGVMTADPRMVPEARPLKIMTYREVAEMAHLGARVIHPRAVEIAMEKGVPLRIKCTFSDAPGTLITDSGRGIEGTAIRSDKVVTGVAHIANVAQIKITTREDVNKSGLVRTVFRALADASISVDIINVFPQMIAFTVSGEVLEKALDILKSGAIDSSGLDPSSIDIEGVPGCAKVSVVGAGMRGVPGVMATVVEALYASGVPILQTSDSHTSISCLVKKDDMQKAMRSLHARFGLGL